MADLHRRPDAIYVYFYIFYSKKKYFHLFLVNCNYNIAKYARNNHIFIYVENHQNMQKNCIFTFNGAWPKFVSRFAMRHRMKHAMNFLPKLYVSFNTAALINLNLIWVSGFFCVSLGLCFVAYPIDYIDNIHERKN